LRGRSRTSGPIDHKIAPKNKTMKYSHPSLFRGSVYLRVNKGQPFIVF
jgi:hypothetical protein